MFISIAKHRLGFIILAAYLVLAFTYSIVNPLFESPDEIWHYEYVRWLVEGNGLATPEDVGHAPWHQEGSQPPLYYLAAAAVTTWVPTDNASDVIRYNPHAAVGQAESFGNKNVMIHGSAEEWPWKGVTLAAHLARFFSILLGAITVWMTYLTARLFWVDGITKPEQEWVAFLASALIAFNPQFLFLSAAANNDNLVTCLSAIGIWYGLWLVKQASAEPTFRHPLSSTETKPTYYQVALFGFIAGLAALSKLSGLLLSLFVAVTLALIAWNRRSIRALILWGLISGTAMVTISGWWYLRNWILFGDPLALSAMFDILPRRAEPPSIDELIARAEGIWNSLWAVFGWFNVVVSPQLYWFYSVLTLVGCGGFLGLLVRRAMVKATANSEDLGETQRLRLFQLHTLLLLIWIGMLLVSLWRWAQMRYPQGRLLYPALSAMTVLVAVGLNEWLPQRLVGRARVLSYVSMVSMMFLAATAIPWLYIAPSYRPLALSAADVSSIQGDVVSPSELRNTPQPRGTASQLSIPSTPFGEQLQLEDAQFFHDERQPGQGFALTLNWRALGSLSQNYSVFVHLIDENDILQAQSDSYPGQGNLPTSEWEAGDIVIDHHMVEIPHSVPSPSRLKVNIGLYDFASGERLLINGSDHWTLGFIRLSPPVGDGTLPNSVFVNFEDQIALIGYEFDRYVLSPGDTLILKLWWEALDAPLRDIKVFTHLVLPPEATWAQDDDRPRAGTSKTDTWQIGDRIEDQYEMTLPTEAPSGVYFVEIGLYDGETYKRLKVNFSDKGTVIGQVRVIE